MTTGRDELHNYERAYVGRSARVDVPLKSVVSLRRVADELRGLANKIEFLSHELHERPTYVMLGVRDAVRRCNRNMAAIRGRGRPKKSQPIDPKHLTQAVCKSRKPAAKHKM
jgi:hypothetical protein